MSAFLPDERVLPDDYPIYGDYIYLADGKVYRSDWHGVTVSELKRREGFKEVRSCNWRRYNGTNQQILDMAADLSRSPEGTGPEEKSVSQTAHRGLE